MPLRLSVGLLCFALSAFVVSPARANKRPSEEPAAKPAAAPAEAPAPAGPAAAAAPSVEKLVDAVRPSVAVISVAGRDGGQQGLGAGFIVSPDGLIATNYHVIGDGRPITVQLADQRRFEVQAVHASDRAGDLAILRIDAQGLPALELGDSLLLKQGQPIVAIGNPHGLEFSVVTGVVSGTRELEGRSMIQLAVPIEPGNSGGPLLDLDGKVQGILTMKSLVTPNLGFALMVNSLRPLLEKPNPIPMERWLTIGALDPQDWAPLFGARWRQRAGRVTVEGAGEGFGGRSLCLSTQPVPSPPYELGVSVKLDNEAGAAGLAFSCDGQHEHFGFYPSAGKLRLTHFGGPDVSTWHVLRDEPSPHYRPGDWNALKVRVEAEKVLCYVNDQLVFDVAVTAAAAGQAGLAKFRETKAEFRRFRLGAEVPNALPAAEVAQQVADLTLRLSEFGPAPAVLADELAPTAPASIDALRRQAERLERQAAQLRELSLAVHRKQVLARLAEVFAGGEDQADLWHAALLVAWLDNDELDVESYRRELDRIAAEIEPTLPAEANEAARLQALHRYLFEANGFHGSRHDYYNRSNSYVNEVLDDREGLPIALSVVYMELARRLDLRVEGVGLPGHFVVRHVPKEGEPAVIDVFDGGKTLTADEVAKLVAPATGQPISADVLKPADKRAIVVRMLKNLLGAAQGRQDLPAMLRYLDASVTVSPDAAVDRWYRAVCRFQAQQFAAAREDCDWLLERQPADVDLNRVHELRDLTAGR